MEPFVRRTAPRSSNPLPDVVLVLRQELLSRFRLSEAKNFLQQLDLRRSRAELQLRLVSLADEIRHHLECIPLLNEELLPFVLKYISSVSVDTSE